MVWIRLDTERGTTCGERCHLVMERGDGGVGGGGRDPHRKRAGESHKEVQVGGEDGGSLG